ncbi:hypothetical protein BH24ACT26_BH24ACT26_07050 [soil metagenome]
MGTLQAVRVAKSRPDRDEELRYAHQRAFAKIFEARSSKDSRAAVSSAVQELIDACEAYAEAG